MSQDHSSTTSRGPLITIESSCAARGPQGPYFREAPVANYACASFRGCCSGFRATRTCHRKHARLIKQGHCRIPGATISLEFLVSAPEKGLGFRETGFDITLKSQKHGPGIRQEVA